MSLDNTSHMRLDNTSHPGRRGPDELVPSRYALRVGEIDVLGAHVSYELVSGRAGKVSPENLRLS